MPKATSRFTLKMQKIINEIQILKTYIMGSVFDQRMRGTFFRASESWT